MAQNIEDNKRIVRNTLMLYMRMMLIMIVSLYTSRVLLRELGVQDFGIYNVVGGAVSLLSFLNTALANGFQRFFNIEIGLGNRQKLQELFSSSLFIQMALIGLCLFMAETIGIWFVRDGLVVADGREDATFILYQCVVVIFMITLLRTPYNAIIFAYERMDAYAIISIAEVILNLGVVFCLQAFPGDKLAVYGFLLVIVQILIFVCYFLYVKVVFRGLKSKIVAHKMLIRQLFSFSGWNLFGSIAHLLRENGVNIVLNLFFGPVVNAARGISHQVSAGIYTFASNFQLASRPQMIKSYARGEYDELLHLCFSITRLSFYLLWVLAVVMVVNIEFVLQLWLGEIYPEKTVSFTVLAIVISLLDAFANPITTIVHATGVMKRFQMTCSSIILLIVPASYLFLRYGCPPETVYIVSIVILFVVHCVRLHLLRKLVTFFSIKEYVRRAISPCFKVVLISSVLLAVVVILFDSTLLLLFFSAMIPGATVCVFGMTSEEKRFVYEKLISVAKKRI